MATRISYETYINVVQFKAIKYSSVYFSIIMMPFTSSIKFLQLSKELNAILKCSKAIKIVSRLAEQNDAIYCRKTFWKKETQRQKWYFSNFSCMFLNPSIFSNFNINCQVWETFSNKLKKHSVTKNCSNLSLFEYNTIVTKIVLTYCEKKLS